MQRALTSYPANSGSMPASVGSLMLTVNAIKNLPNGNTATASATFVITISASVIADSSEYPLDLTGLLSSNLITGETQTLTPYNGPLHQLLVPIVAPFFGTSLVVTYYNASATAITAVNGVDYELVFEYEALSQTCLTPVYGGISFLNPNIIGTVFLQYQTLGGNFALDRQYLIEQLFNYSVNPLFFSWGAVTGKPTFFPVESHTLNVENDTVGYATLVSALNAIATAVAVVVTNSDIPPMLTHMASVSNPHNTTANQLGLGNVQNYPLATLSQAIDPTNASVYLTPLTAYAAINYHLYSATTIVNGKMLLNLGLDPGDDTDETKGLTALGLINLLEAIQPNAINSIVDANVSMAQQVAQVTPRPPTFPCWWKGVQYASFAALINAIETYVGISPLPYNASSGLIYFPVGISIPELVTSPTLVTSTQIAMTVGMPVTYPLIVNE